MNKFEVETLTFQKPRPTLCPSFNIKRVWDSIIYFLWFSQFFLNVSENGQKSLELQQFELQLI